MLMLSLNNFIGSVNLSNPAVLGPPQMLSLAVLGKVTFKSNALQYCITP